MNETRWTSPIPYYGDRPYEYDEMSDEEWDIASRPEGVEVDDGGLKFGPWGSRKYPVTISLPSRDCDGFSEWVDISEQDALVIRDFLNAWHELSLIHI